MLLSWASALLVLLSQSQWALARRGSAIKQPAGASSEYVEYKTEPDFRAVKIEFTNGTFRNNDVHPGHIFIAPFLAGNNGGGYGPQMFDQQGELVWYGNVTAQHRAMNAHVCSYAPVSSYGRRKDPQDVICFHDSVPTHSAYGPGAIHFLDSSYTYIRTVFSNTGKLGEEPDLHELHTPSVTNGESILYTVYHVTPLDLRAFKGPRKGYALNGCFQEKSLQSREVLFEWCALDHFAVWDTEVFLKQSANYTTPIAGDGSWEEPWDFFHINSVDKNAEGDYLVSARHLNAILKIAGPNYLTTTTTTTNPNTNITMTRTTKSGDVLWRLGGHNRSDFSMGFNFSRQHMARFVSENETHTVLSHFDNAYDGHVATANNSAGQLISLDHRNNTAQVITSYPSPTRELSDSQGSIQILDNNNAFIGWGFKPEFSEFSANGTLLYHAHFSGTRLESYRIYKQRWRGTPRTRPKLLVYSRECRTPSPLVAYASWNGATEVSHWRFFVSNGTAALNLTDGQPGAGAGAEVHNAHAHTHSSWLGRTRNRLHSRDLHARQAYGPNELAAITQPMTGSDDDSSEPVAGVDGVTWTPAGKVWKQGFETAAMLSKTAFSLYTYAEALDFEGNVLGRSEVATTFTPSKHVSQACDYFGCYPWQFFDYDRLYSKTRICVDPDAAAWEEELEFREERANDGLTSLIEWWAYVAVLVWLVAWIGKHY